MGWSIGNRQVLHFAIKVPLFKDVGEQSGLPLGDFLSRYVVMEDYNGDGYSDVYYVGFPSIINLYKNCQDGTFIEAGSEAGIPGGDYTVWSALFIDIDNDGDRDLFLGRR